MNTKGKSMKSSSSMGSTQNEAVQMKQQYQQSQTFQNAIEETKKLNQQSHQNAGKSGSLS